MTKEQLYEYCKILSQPHEDDYNMGELIENLIALNLNKFELFMMFLFRVDSPRYKWKRYNEGLIGKLETPLHYMEYQFEDILCKIINYNSTDSYFPIEMFDLIYNKLYYILIND